MYPVWGGGFGGFPPRGPAPPPPSAAAANPNLLSFHEQHLQQMQQLQQLHQRQLQSVLHYNNNGGSSGGGPPPWPPAAPGPAPAPEPPKPGNDAPPDPSPMSRQEQQDFWYQQHLQNLQKLKNENPKAAGDSAPKLDQPPGPPPPKETPPPPPPKEEQPPPPPPDEKSSGVEGANPEEAARLQQLQAAAAHWQQVQYQRAGFQYQALMQEHTQLQQILQQYQQVIQHPPHLQSLSVDMQLQHYERQQQAFGPLLQQWDQHFKLWLGQFQAYPHKDQLQEYEGQWKQWQEQMTSTSAHLNERVSTLKAVAQPYGAAPPFPPVMGSFGQPRPPAPNVDAAGAGGAQTLPGLNTAESGPPHGPEAAPEPFRPTGPAGPIVRPPGHHAGFEGHWGPRFEAPRGPRFDQNMQQHFGGSRFAGQHFGMFPRPNHIRPGPPGRFDNPLRPHPPNHFERPAAPPVPPTASTPPSSTAPPAGLSLKSPAGPPGGPAAGPPGGPAAGPPGISSAPPAPDSQFKPKPGPEVQTKSGAEKSQTPVSAPKADQKSMSDDVMESCDAFFVQNDPIPQSQTDKKPNAELPGVTAENKEPEKDKHPASAPLPVQPRPVPDKAPPNFAPQRGPPPTIRPEIPKQPSMDQSGPPNLGRGRGRGQPPVFHGRGRARGRGQIGRPLDLPSRSEPDFNGEDPAYEAQQEENNYNWEYDTQEPPEELDESEAHELWQPEEQQFDEEYNEEYYEPAEQGPHRGHMGPPEGSGEHWQQQEEEEEEEYWEEEEPHWAERRPPMYHRPPFPHEGPRRPPFLPRFMPFGPRRPPPFAPMPLMGPRFRRGLGPRVPPPPRHDMMGRGIRRPPPPPHEILEREPLGPPGYHEEMKLDPAWERGHVRHGAPHEMIERRPPMRPHPMQRDRWRPAPSLEDPQGDYDENYGAEDDVHRRAEFRPRDYLEDEEMFHPRDDWRRERPDFAPRHPPHGPGPEQDRWLDERERLFPDEGEERRRMERRPEYDLPYREKEHQPPYSSRPEWERSSPPLPERVYPAPTEDSGSLYQRNLDLPVAHHSSEAPLDPVSPGGSKTVLALSQRQHEIILKAAQELKLIRELQKGKNVLGDSANLESGGLPSELPSGLLGLDIPAEVKNALQSTGLLSGGGPELPAQSLEPGLPQTAQVPDYLRSSSSLPPTPSFITQTVDYGHGRDTGAKVERISYGERIVLRPDPLPERTDRYEREMLSRRDPFFDRRGEQHMEVRDYGRDRERDMFRDRVPPDYDRARMERERYSRDDRSPAGPLRPGYREREREVREPHPTRSSRDRELYGRQGYERSSYERSVDRFEHGSSSYNNDRRGYHDDPAPPPVSQRVEKKPEVKNIDDLLKAPGRNLRPDRIVVIMRGLPGSGKSHVAKLIRDKEVEHGGAPPRVLGLDDYFMTEVEKEVRDPDTGKRIKTKVLEYEYEPEMEDTYRSSMLKTFKKTLDDGFFPFIILDAINDRVKYFEQFWSAAKTKGFEVYVAEISADHQVCAKRNIHGRKLKDITKLGNSWESAPVHMVRLDIRSLLQDAAIEEVEMEDFNPLELDTQEEEEEEKKEEEEEAELGYLPKSKWEMDTSEAKLDKLDGLASGGKRKRTSDTKALEDFLQLPDDYASRMSEPGKKRVRWADLEEQKDVDRKRAIGFVVGQTDWEKITDESGQLAQRALNRTKYF